MWRAAPPGLHCPESVWEHCEWQLFHQRRRRLLPLRGYQEQNAVPQRRPNVFLNRYPQEFLLVTVHPCFWQAWPSLGHRLAARAIPFVQKPDLIIARQMRRILRSERCANSAEFQSVLCPYAHGLTNWHLGAQKER